MNLREAAQQALEAMDKATRFMSDSDYVKLNQAITALKAALEQPNEDYERGFVDGMSEQAKRSVDRAVNRMADAMEQPKPFHINKFISALIASRLIDQDAVEDPEGYDDGVTMDKVNAAYGRLT